MRCDASGAFFMSAIAAAFLTNLVSIIRSVKTSTDSVQNYDYVSQQLLYISYSKKTRISAMIESAFTIRNYEMPRAGRTKGEIHIWHIVWRKPEIW